MKYVSDGPNANWANMEATASATCGRNGSTIRFIGSRLPVARRCCIGARRAAIRSATAFSSILVALPFLLHRLDDVKYPYDIVQLRWTKGDNGPPDEAVMNAVREWNAKYAYPPLVIATTSEAFHAFEQRYGDKLPTYRGDITPYWEDGVASRPAKPRQPPLGRPAAAGRDDLGHAGKGDFPAADFAAAWKNVALYTSTPGARTTASASPTCPSSSRSGSTSRPTPWTPTGNRGSCWSRPWIRQPFQADTRARGFTGGEANRAAA